jgi:hypothetical protein
MHKHQGMILITSLAIIAIVAALLLQLNSKFYHAVRLTAAWQHKLQVQLFAQGELAWAEMALLSAVASSIAPVRQWRHRQAAYLISSKLQPITAVMPATKSYPLIVQSVLRNTLSLAAMVNNTVLLVTRISRMSYSTTYYSLLYYSKSANGLCITLLWQINSEQ